MSSESELIECAFLIPLVRDSDRQPHLRACWRAMQDVLFEEFEGYSGPESWFRIYRRKRPTPGAYESEAGARVQDESRRYVVAVPRGRLPDLRRILRRAANTFDQEAVYLSIAGVVEFVSAVEEDGHL